MTCLYCKPLIEMKREARELRKDHALWFARNVATKDRKNIEDYAGLVSGLKEDIELVESQSGGDQ